MIDSAIRIWFSFVEQQVQAVCTRPYSMVVSPTITVKYITLELATRLRFDTVGTFLGVPSTFTYRDRLYPGLLGMCIRNVNFAEY
jgi:hypothetical protein